MQLPQHVRERRQRHRRAGMARLGLLHGVHGERADGIDAELIDVHARGGLGRSNPDLAACQSLVSRSKPSTRTSTCCGEGVACAAILSSSTILGISLRPCFALSIPIWFGRCRISSRAAAAFGTCHKYSAVCFPSAHIWPSTSIKG